MVQIKSIILLLSIIGFWINDETVVTASIVDSLCVQTYDDLKKSVLGASTTNYTQIDICTKLILLESYLNVTNKWIDLRCRMSKGRRCTLDAQNRFGLVFGTNVHFKTNSINFINGIGISFCSAGCFFASPIFLDNSNIIMNNTSIMNINTFSSAVGFYSDKNHSLLLDNVLFQNNTASGATVSIDGYNYSIIRSRLSNSVGAHLVIVRSNGIIMDSVFEKGIANAYDNVQVFSYGFLNNWTTVFKNTTFVRNGQQAYGATLSMDVGTNVILDDVVFRANYGTNITFNNTIIIDGNTAALTSLLKCSGKTKFCDNHFRIVDKDLNVLHKGTTNCYDKRFQRGC